MFTSVSKCVPGSTVTTSFIATINGALDIDVNFNVYISGTLKTGRPVAFLQGQEVKISFIAPPGYLENRIIPFTINGLTHYFAVANKAESLPTIKTEAYQKRWWDYSIPPSQYLTYRYIPTGDTKEITLGSTTKYDLFANLFPILDKPSNGVYFYGQNGFMLTKITLPSAPIQIIFCDFSSGEKYYLVSCADGFLYKIALQKDITQEAFLQNDNPPLPTDWLFQLPFEEEIPFVGDFLSLAVQKIAVLDSQSPKVLSFKDNAIWVGGYRRVWKLNQQLQVTQTTSGLLGLVKGIQSLGNTCITTMKNGKVYKITSTTSKIVYSGKWLGNPISFGTLVYFADAATHRIVKLNVTAETTTFFSTGDFFPSYIFSDATKLYICGLDSRTVYECNGIVLGTAIKFKKRVTHGMAFGFGMFVSHLLDKTDTLDYKDQQSIEFDEVTTIGGPISYIGSKPGNLKLNGVPGTPTISPDTMWYVDGVLNAPITENCMLSVCVLATMVGQIQRCIVFGDSVIDFNFTANNSTYDPRFIDIPTIDPSIGQYDIILTDITTPFYASIDYGYIKKNFNDYWGDSTFKNGDVLSIYVPNVTEHVSLLSLGKTHIYVPVSNKPTRKLEHNNVTRNTQIDVSFGILEDGDYKVPHTFSSENSPISLGTYQFLAGQNISLSQLSSKRVYDTRQLFILGPTQNIDIRTRTDSGLDIVPFTFDTLFEPYIRFTYDSNSWIPTFSAVPSLNLVSPLTSISIAGSISSVLHSGQEVILTRRINNLFEKDAILYAVVTDPLDTTSVNVDIAYWPIINISPNSSLKEPNTDYELGSFQYILTKETLSLLSGFSFDFSKSQAFFTDGKLQGQEDQHTSFISSGLISSQQDNRNSSLGVGPISLEIQDSFSTANVNQTKSEISSAFESVGNQSGLDIQEGTYEANTPSQGIASHDVSSNVLSSNLDNSNTKVSRALQSLKENGTEFKSITRLVHQVDQLNEKLSARYSIFVDRDAIKELFVFNSIKEQIETKTANVVQYIQLQQVEKFKETIPSLGEHLDSAHFSSTINVLTPDKEYTNSIEIPKLLIEVNQEILVELQKLEFDMLAENLYVIDSIESLAEHDSKVWLNDISVSTGAFTSALLAEQAAIRRNMTPVEILQIPGTNLFTYRKLSSLTRVCGLGNVMIYAKSGLIQGG